MAALVPRALASWLSLAGAAAADRLVLADGTVLENVYARDEGTRFAVWRRLEDVGGEPEYLPRSRVKEHKVERDEAWDVRPNLPDLSVTFIEMNPKLPGFHGRVEYDSLGRPILKGAKAFADLGERAALEPEKVVAKVKLAYRPGEEIALAAHVKNVGFATARPFRYAWLLDGVEAASGLFERSLGEMEEATFLHRMKWKAGLHHVTFRVRTEERQIATINDEATDPLWGWGLVYIVHPRRVEAWHRHRTAYGTFSFEDFYRWHVEIMNRLFEASVYPSAPEGIRARVRLDRIVYAEDPEKAAAEAEEEDGLRRDQGRWIWFDDDDRKKEWKPPTKEWRNQTEWSLPHELGHQLGLTDLYNLDDKGTEAHRMPDNGDPVVHLMRRPHSMMHWHGPHVWSEVCAGYLNQSWDKPRGHYGDHHFAIPAENFVEVLDVNGRPVAGAKIEIFQRGVLLDPEGKGGEEAGVRWSAVVEDGTFKHPMSGLPVIVGETGPDGRMRLPNRPAMEVRTLNRFHRKPNPFGNLNVVGERGLMLAWVTKGERRSPFFLEIAEFNAAWFRGEKERHIVRLSTPYGSEDSPPPPRVVRAEGLDGARARVTWTAPAISREAHSLERVNGYRVWRRHSSYGLNDRPWFPVATTGPEAREATLDLRQLPAEVYWLSEADRFAVSTLGELGLQSGLVEVLLPPR